MVNKQTDTGLRFPDYRTAEIHRVQKLRTVYTVDGRTFATKKSATRAAWTRQYFIDHDISQMGIDEEGYPDDSVEKEKFRWWKMDPYLSASISQYDAAQEQGEVFHVTVDGQLVKEVATLLIAEETVCAVENQQRRAVNEIVTLFGGGVERAAVEEECPWLAFLIRSYTYEELKHAHQTMESHLVDILRATPVQKNIPKHAMTQRRSRAFKRAMSHLFAESLYEKTQLISGQFGDDDGDFTPALDIALAMVDYEQVVAEAFEQDMKRNDSVLV